MSRIARAIFDNPEAYKTIDLFDVVHHFLSAAAFVGDIELLKLLLLVLDLDDTFDNQAIQYAAQEGHLEIVQFLHLLQDSKFDPSGYDHYAIRIASEHGCLSVVQYLLQDSRVNPSAEENSAIIHASRRGYLEVVECLLKDDRVDPSQYDSQAVLDAAANGHLAVVKTLFGSGGVDIWARDSEAIRFAVANGHLETVKYLLSCHGVNPAARDNEAIKSAAKMGNLEMVQLLLKDQGVDAAAEDNFALRLAFFYKHSQVYEILKSELLEQVDSSAGFIMAARFGVTDLLNHYLQDPTYTPSTEEVVKAITAAAADYRSATTLLELLLTDSRLDRGQVIYTKDAMIRQANSNGWFDIVELLERKIVQSRRR